MPEPRPPFSGIVLHRLQTGENHLRLMVASAELGLQSVLARQSRKAGATLPDLFDSGEFTVETARGSAQFLKEFRLERRRTALGRSYTAFQRACECAEVFRKNLEHLEDAAEPVALLEKALNAFEEGPRPDVTLLKSLYLLARMEGFPVKEQWLGDLPARQRRQAKEALNLPLSEQTADETSVDQLLLSLKAWLRGVDFAF